MSGAESLASRSRVDGSEVDEPDGKGVWRAFCLVEVSTADSASGISAFLSGTRSEDKVDDVGIDMWCVWSVGAVSRSQLLDG